MTRKRRTSLEVATSKRELLQERLRIQQLESAIRLYEGGKGTSQRPKRGSGASGDAVMASTGNRLRETVRYLEENDGITAGVLDDLVNNVVGTGVTIEPMAKLSDDEPAEALNRSLRELYAEWHERPEITGEFPGNEVERMVCRTWLRDGEMFAQHVTGLLAPHNSSVPYSLELLEPDFVPMDSVSQQSSNTVIHGVETDTWGRRLAYYVYLQHPGNTLSPFGSGALSSSLLRTKRVQADRMMHVRFVRRLHQTRGVPIMHSAVNTLYDLKDAWESERVAMRVAAAFTGYIKKSPDYQSTSIDDTTGARELELAPGMIWDSLMPGEEVGTIGHDRPNQAFDPFTQALLRTVAGATGTRYSAIAKRYDGTYSSQRQELVEGAVSYRRLLAYLIGVFYRPVWRRLIDAARLSGRLVLPRNVNEKSIYAPEFRGPVLPWIDPLKEIQAFQIAVQAGFKSRHQVIRDMGSDPTIVDAQLQMDMFEPVGAAPQQSAATDEADETEDEDAA